MLHRAPAQDATAESLVALGADPEAASEFVAALDAEENPPVPVYEENRDAFEAWMLVRTQWRVGLNGPTGLDYAGVRAALALARRRMTPQLFADLQVMERAALGAFAELAEEARRER